MTPMPLTKLANLASRRFVRPKTAPSTANTRQAAGIENFFWISMTAMCVEMPWRSSVAMCVRSSAIDISRSPLAGPLRGNTVSGSRLSTSCRNLVTL